MGRVMTRKGPQTGTVGARIAETCRRLGFTEKQSAEYLGVPVATYRKWVSGDREPNTVVERLMDVLGTIEVMASSIHEGLMPD